MALVKILRILSTLLIVFGIVLRTIWVAELLAFCCPAKIVILSTYMYSKCRSSAICCPWQLCSFDQGSPTAGNLLELLHEDRSISWRLIGIQFIRVLLLQGYGLQCCRNNFRCQRSDKWTETDCPEVGLLIVTWFYLPAVPDSVLSMY